MEWTTNITNSNITEIEYDYISKNRMLYGIHEVVIIYNNNKIKAKAKFDTGARSSSIDLQLAKRLGISEELFEAYKELEKVEIPKDITNNKKKLIEKKYTDEYSEKFSDVSSVQISKSASGFSIRPYVKVKLHFNGKYVETEVNLKDRAGLECEMLVGLKDLL